MFHAPAIAEIVAADTDGSDLQSHSHAMFDAHWGRADQLGLTKEPGELRRIATVARLCPPVASMLDVGCGDGQVLQALAEQVQTRIGCDGSRSGLSVLMRSPGQPLAMQASVARLPFADRSFEMVSCCDVLEHLPEPVMLATIQELMRVTARYLLINVPLAEDLSWSLSRCQECGVTFHRDHHQRRFLQLHVQELLPASTFHLVTLEMTGGTVRRIAGLPRRLGAALALGHSVESFCPNCGATPQPLTRSRLAVRVGITFVHNALTKPLTRWLTRDTEIVALFERRR